MEEPILNDLDAALHELGMLSSVTESRCEYLREQNRNNQSNSVDPVNRKTLGILRFVNTRFVKMVETADLGMNSRREHQFQYPSLDFSKKDLRRYQPYTTLSESRREPHRYKPYTLLSAREERIRTKSENSDVDTDWLCGSTLTPVIQSTPDCCGLYKSRSLEDVKVILSDETDEDIPAPEVESVSDQIQHLQVSE